MESATENLLHLDFIIAYEGGDIDDDEVIIEGGQAIINDGLVWQLQGSWGRLASNLIEAGVCHA